MSRPASHESDERTHWPGEDSALTAEATSAILKPSERLGRYVVLYRLGVGGMGVVYAAYDPKLDRKVALKLMRRVSSDPARQKRAKDRLLEEARSLARLTHPNVLTVHDVGEYEGRVFIAMELIEGSTLTEAMTRGDMRWRDVLRVMIPAGRGLAAAHEAGLVHRDFKPDNVMLAKDGRVLVMDFGLARARDPDDSSDSLPGGSDHPTARRRPLPVVGTHKVGTPAYMAPEQRAGEPIDGRSDQFSYCVTLYEALYGHRPFAGETPEEIAEAVAKGAMLEPPQHSRVPSWVRLAVLQGLSPRPADRFPSLDELLATLEDDPAIRRRRYLMAAGVLATLGFGAAGTYALQASVAPVCDRGEDRLEGAWTPQVARMVEKAFLASDKPYAKDVWKAVQTSLDGYATRWSDMHLEACEATRVRGEQSDELLDLRMECLERRLTELRALADLFQDADADVVRSGVSATGKLVPLSVCADAELLRTPIRPPDEPQLRAQIEAVREEIARAQAHRAAGRYAAGLAIAEAAVERARELEHPPLLAESHLEEAELQFLNGRVAESREGLQQAIAAAAKGRHDDVAARAWIFLVVVTGHGLSKPDTARELSIAAEAAVERVGGAPDLRADLSTARAAIARLNGDFAGARAAFERALTYQREAFGDDHPNVAKGENNLGVAAFESGDVESGLVHMREALRLHERYLGPDHPQVATLLSNLGGMLIESGRPEEGLRSAERSVEIWERVSGGDHPNLGQALLNLGTLHVVTGAHERAIEELTRSRDIMQRAMGEHPDVAKAHQALGGAYLAAKQYAEARSHMNDARELFRKLVGEQHPFLAYALIGLGEAELGLGRKDAAAEAFERSLAILEASPAETKSLPLARFGLAQAIVEREPGRALELAEQARKGFEVLPEGHPERRVEDVERWLGEVTRAGARN